MEARHQFCWCGLILVLAWSACGAAVLAQTKTQAVQPYAVMDRENVTYRGVGREGSSDLKGDIVKIGILLPLSGTRALEGKKLLQAAQLAIDEENKHTPLGNRKRFELALQDENGQWGQASNALIHLIIQDKSVALITSTDGSIAHQAEQIANKIGIPIVTLSSDATTTRINIPWIFRVGPSDADQAKAIALQIYGAKGLQKVLMVAERGHDGRVGEEEFSKAATAYQVERVERVEIDAGGRSIDAIVEEIRSRKADAVVLWTGPEVATQLIPGLREAIPATPIYLNQRAADSLPENTAEASPQHSLLFTVSGGVRSGGFGKQYLERTGAEAGIAAWQMDEAVHSIANAIRRTGANRARVRDYLAATGSGDSAESAIPFDSAGNARYKASLVSLTLPSDKAGLAKPN